MNNPIPMKGDRRFKKGNVKKDKKGTLRGHPDTMELKRVDVPVDNSPELERIRMNPPIVISSELADALKREGVV